MAESDGRTGGRCLKVVETACEILELLAREDEVGVTELAGRLDVPKTTAHSYLRSLEECGLARNDGGRYAASLRLLELGGRVRERQEMYEVARPEADALARATGEAVNVGVHERGRQVVLYAAEGEDAVWDQPTVGSHAYLNQTAIGKAILSRLPAEAVDRIVDRHGLPAETSHTITDRETLRAELATVRERGYALQNGEYQEGIFALGRPVCVDGAVIGAVSVTGPTSRLGDDDAREEYVDALVECVNVIELKYEHYL